MWGRRPVVPRWRGGAKGRPEVRGLRGTGLYKCRLAKAVAATSPGWGRGALRVVEDGLHGVLTEGVYPPSDAFDFVRRDLDHNGAESRLVVPTVVGVGA